MTKEVLVVKEGDWFCKESIMLNRELGAVLQATRIAQSRVYYLDSMGCEKYISLKSVRGVFASKELADEAYAEDKKAWEEYSQVVAVAEAKRRSTVEAVLARCQKT